jgi:hypothetical protein
MAGISIKHVDIAYVNRVWPFVVEFVQEALTSGPDFPDWHENYNADHVQMFLTSGSWLLVVAVDDDGKIHGAATVAFANYPKHRVAFVTTIGGKLISSPETFQQFKELLKQRGATKIQGYGRDTIVRLWKRFGFEPRLTLVEVLV